MTDRIQILTMPKWGMTMTEGKVTAWFKDPGDQVEPGEDFVEIETEKISNVVESQMSGLVRRLLVLPGQTAPCGAPIALLAEADVPEDELDAVAATAEASVVTEAALSEARVDAGGLSLNVISAGKDGDAPLILLHGFGSDAGSWMFVQEGLAEDRRVHAIDLPSHGQSDVDPAIASIPDLGARLQAVIDTLAPGPLHLAGHSLGGRLALWLADALGDRVQSLTLIAPAGIGQPVNAAFVQGFIAADKRRPMKEALRLLVADESSIGADMVERALAAKRIDGVGAALAAIAAGSLGPASEAAAMDDLAALSVPVLTIWGERDRVIAPPPGRDAVIVVGAGHMPQMEAAAEVNALIAQHIGGAG